MTARSQSDILALLLEADRHLEPVNELSSESDPDVSAVLLESIKKAQETNNLEFTPEDNAFVDSCLAFNSDNDWEFMRTALLDALNTPNSDSLKNPYLDLDEEMLMERESDGENAEEEVESREGIFGIWNLDIEEASDEEIGLIKDLENILSIGDGSSTDTSTVTGTAVQEGLSSELRAQTVNIEELVAGQVKPKVKEAITLWLPVDMDAVPLASWSPDDDMADAKSLYAEPELPLVLYAPPPSSDQTLP